MKHYRKIDGSVWAFPGDGSQDSYITEEMSLMTAQEVEAHLNPPPIYKHELDALNLVYKEDVENFNRAFAIAYLSDGPSQEPKQSAIRAQYEARKIKHAENTAALKVRYGIGA